MDKISVIVPIYNVGKYLKKCLDSLLLQTHSNIELLLVNDGSTDDSADICDEYARRDSRVKLFHKPNGGVASARNLGLGHLTGDFVGFVDSDDFLEPTMYASLLNKMRAADADISVSSFFIHKNETDTAVTNLVEVPQLLSTKELLLYPLQRDNMPAFGGYLWNKLFTAKSLEGLTFDESLQKGEDVLFYYEAVTKGKLRGCYTDIPLYHYRQRMDSLTKTDSVSVKHDSVITYKKVEELLVNSGYADIGFWARGFRCHHASVTAEVAYREKDMITFRLMQNEIRQCYQDYIETNKDFPEKIKRINYLINKEQDI